MKPFVIFAIVLTVAYIIYYTIVIVQDLYGKPKEEKSNAESFDVSDMTEDNSIAVTESDGGFSVGDNRYETTYEERQQEEQPDSGKKNGGISAIDKVNAKLEGKMEETQAVSDDAVYSEDLTRIMLAKGIRKPGRPNVRVESLTKEI